MFKSQYCGRLCVNQPHWDHRFLPMSRPLGRGGEVWASPLQAQGCGRLVARCVGDLPALSLCSLSPPEPEAALVSAWPPGSCPHVRMAGVEQRLSRVSTCRCSPAHGLGGWAPVPPQALFKSVAAFPGPALVLSCRWSRFDALPCSPCWRTKLCSLSCAAVKALDHSPLRPPRRIPLSGLPIILQLNSAQKVLSPEAGPPSAWAHTLSRSLAGTSHLLAHYTQAFMSSHHVTVTPPAAVSGKWGQDWGAGWTIQCLNFFLQMLFFRLFGLSLYPHLLFSCCW